MKKNNETNNDINIEKSTTIKKTRDIEINKDAANSSSIKKANYIDRSKDTKSNPNILNNKDAEIDKDIDKPINVLENKESEIIKKLKYALLRMKIFLIKIKNKIYPKISRYTNKIKVKLEPTVNKIKIKLKPLTIKINKLFSKLYSFVFLDNEQYTNTFRIKRIILFILFTFVLQVFITTCSVFVVVKAGGKNVRLKNVIGLNMFNAFEILQKDGLVLRIESNFFSDRELGSVIMQEPRAGTTVKQGRVITLVVNSATENVIIMPDLSGKTEKEAYRIITNEILSKNSNVTIDSPNEISEKDKDIDVIVSQLPFANEAIFNDTKILLTINRERKINTVKVDDYTNKDINSVMSYFDSYRIPFEIKHIDTEDNNMQSKVLSQSVAPGDYRISEIKNVVFTVGKKVNDKIKVQTFRYTFPLDKVEDTDLKVVLDDANGRDVLYEKMVKAGDNIYFSFRVFSNGTITIFHNGEPVETRNIN